MCVHLFGAVSSPSCANFALRQTVTDNDCIETEEGKTVIQNFYVDDLLKSKDTVQSTIDITHKVQDLCSSGGFNLTKFVFNEESVVNSVPLSKRSSEVSKEISKSTSIERALGVHWCLESDVFSLSLIHI